MVWILPDNSSKWRVATTIQSFWAKYYPHSPAHAQRLIEHATCTAASGQRCRSSGAVFDPATRQKESLCCISLGPWLSSKTSITTIIQSCCILIESSYCGLCRDRLPEVSFLEGQPAPPWCKGSCGWQVDAAHGSMFWIFNSFAEFWHCSWTSVHNCATHSGYITGFSC